MSMERDSLGGVSTSSGTDPRSQLLQEMREQNFDLIRFASYRTACKLRYVQKKCNLHVIDIWNVIEAFRENALNTLEPNACVNVTRLETLVSSLYHNLNKRLPPAHQVSVEACSALLLNWLLSAYSTGENVGKIRVFSIKVALATMCAGKLTDKLRYMFSQLSDGNGHLLMKRLSDYLREVLALPAAVYESPSFSYTDSLPLTIFNQNVKITVNDFLDTLMSDPGPPCLVWLPLLHRLASVENVVHPLACSACRRGSLTGFRYRCTRCANYTMCQDCFWRGRVSAAHTTAHEVKEYAAYKSPSKQIGATLRKSFRCVPERARAQLPRYPDQPERTLNLSHIVPPSPVPTHNGFPEYTPGYVNTGSLDSRSSRSTHRSIAEHLSRGVDDEHRLIARYAARLAHENRTMPRAGRSASLTPELDADEPSTSEEISLYTPKKKKILNQLNRAKRTIIEQKKHIKRLQEQNRRKVKKILTLVALLTCLKKKTLVSAEQAESLKTLNVTTKELYSRQMKNAKGTVTTSKYSPALRSFALTLHYYSSKAYNYVRKVFNLSLPHPATIRNWYKVIDGNPGFTTESLEALKSMAKKNKGPLYCCLMLDEMAIRRKIEWDGKKFQGYVDFGGGLDTDEVPEAKEALVFMVTGVNANWKGRSSSEGSEVDCARQQRELISQLEGKNREIMREIARLRRQQEAEAANPPEGGGSAPPLVSELRALRQRKDELEGHLSSLQESRKHLMQQLEGLMRMLKTQQSSPRSTPNSSPRSTKSPPLPGSQPQPSAPEREQNNRGMVRSAPQTPSLGERDRMDVNAMTHSLGMEGIGGDGRNFHQNQRPTTMGIDNRTLRSDLLYAADSVTNAMSTLVRELNSEGSDTEDTVKGPVGPRKHRDFEEDEDSDEPMPRPQPPRHYLHDNNVQDAPPPLPARTGHYYPRT